MSSSRIHQLLNAPEGKEIPFWLSQPRQSSRGSGGKKKAERPKEFGVGQGAARDRLSRTDPFHPPLDLRSGAQGPFQRRAPDAFFWTYRAWRTSWFQ